MIELLITVALLIVTFAGLTQERRYGRGRD